MFSMHLHTFQFVLQKKNNNLEAVLSVAASRTAQSNAVTHCVAAHVSSFIRVGEPPNVHSGDPCVKGCVGTAR